MDQQTSENQEAPSVRDSINAAIDSTQDDGGQKDTVLDSAKENPLFKPEDRFDAATEAKPAPGAKPAEEAREPNKLTDTPAQTSARLAQRGPVSWKPEVREKWAALPPEVQGEVTRREREIVTAMQEVATVRQQAADASQFANEFYRTVQPYMQLIALEGNDPLKTFGNYLQTATILRSGAPMEKASALAGAIRQYGIDIQLLDSALAASLNGQPLPQPVAQPNQGPGQPQQFHDPRLDALLANIQQREEQDQAVMQEDVDSEIDTFSQDPKNEFFEDLREDIADLLKFSADRGRKMTLQQAYDQASKIHPEISKVVAQRELAARTAANRSRVAAVRSAGSSITSSTPQQTGSGHNASASVRDAIEQSIQHLGG